MATFHELMQKYVNEDYENLVALAQQAVNNLLPVCAELDKENDGFFLLCSIIFSAVAADNNLTALENQFLQDILPLDNDKIDALTEMHSGAMAALTDRFCDSMGDDVKADTIILVCTIAAVDEKISREETAFIKRLFA